MAKIGISTIASYKGSQIFEALGLGADVIRSCFTGTASRIGGVSFEQLAQDQLRLHAMAYGRQERDLMLPDPGDYHFRCVQGGGTRSRGRNREALLALIGSPLASSQHLR